MPLSSTRLVYNYTGSTLCKPCPLSTFALCTRTLPIAVMQMDVDKEQLTYGDQQGIKKEEREKVSKSKTPKGPVGPMFTLKKWNAVAMWQWDVECDTCAICRVQVMGK